MSKGLPIRLLFSVFMLLAFLACIALIHLLWFGNLGQANLWVVYSLVGVAGAVCAALGWRRFCVYTLSSAAAGLFIQYTVQYFARPATLSPGIWCNVVVSLAGLAVGIGIELAASRTRTKTKNR